MNGVKYSKGESLYRKINGELVEIEITEIFKDEEDEMENTWYYKFKHPNLDDERKDIEIFRSAKNIETNWSEEP